MVFNSFYVNVLFRILVLSATNMGFFYVMIKTDRFFTSLLLGILILLEIIWLIAYVNSTNRNLARFLLTLGVEDSSVISVRDKVEKTFQGLSHSFSRLNQEISRIRLEKEYTSILFTNVIDQLGSGILAWDNQYRIEVLNRAGMDLLDIPSLNSFNELDRFHPELRKTLLKLQAGEKILYTIRYSDKNPASFLIRFSKFLLGNKELSLVSFQNILSELEEKEMESWEKLIRVLTHEVSNSVTPIVTLGVNIRQRLSDKKDQRDDKIILSTDVSQDIIRSAELIEQRGNGLIDFVQQYKSFVRLPRPEFSSARLLDLMEDVCSLYHPLMKESAIDLSCRTDPELVLKRIDRKMMEQVLINLIRNAIDAISGKTDGKIFLEARQDSQDKAIITVSDNGKGICEEDLDQVFVPFFTTKEKGSGIGLSLSRRMIHLHGGTISVQSGEGKGCRVVISLPNQ